MSTTHFITAYSVKEGGPEVESIAGIEMGDRSYCRLQDCDCDLDELYVGQSMETGEELSWEEMMGGMGYAFVRRVKKATCLKAYCHVLAFIKVLKDVYPEGYEATWKTTPDDHPEDIAFSQSLDQQLEDRDNTCESFIPTYDAIKQWMTKYHPEMDDQVDTCISWSHTLLIFAKAVRDKAMETNGDIEIEFAVS